MNPACLAHLPAPAVDAALADAARSLVPWPAPAFGEIIDLAQVAGLTAGDLALWLVQGATAAALVLIVLNIIAHFKRVPPIEAELQALLEKLRAEINTQRLETAQSVAELRQQIEAAHLRVDTLTRDVNAKLQRLPGEIVDLLHKTGAIQPK